MKTCTKCGVSKPLFDFHKAKHRKDGVRSDCKICKNRATSLRVRNNPEKKAAQNKRYRKANPEKKAIIHRRWRQSHPGKVKARTAKYRANKLQATPPWLSSEHHAEIVLCYEEAFALKLYTGQDYHVDHIVPLQGKNVCGLHVPWNLQVILARDNLSKGNKHVDD